MNNKKKKYFIFAVLVFYVFTCGFLFAQEEGNNDSNNSDNIEGRNILEEFEHKSKPLFDKNLQNEFVVVEDVTKHEFNPHITSISSDNEILGNVYEGLFTSHPITLDAQFAIASDYRVSRDKKRWLISLKDNACFSNGERITAYDVKYSWIKLLSTPNAPYASLFDVVKGAADFRNGKCNEDDVGIYVNDEHNISIHLNSPTNYLPKILCHTAFSVVNKNENVYSGAYVIDKVSDDKTELKKNPYYWDKNNVAIEKVVFLQEDDPEERTYLFNTGKADWIMGNVIVDNIIDNDAVQLDSSFGVSFYFFKQSCKNPKKKETGSLWDYREFRNAVMEALPWDEMRAFSFVPATTFVYPLANYPKVDGFDFTDPIEAKIKMEEARKKYNVPMDKIIPLTIDIPAGSVSESVMDSIISSLEPIGVEVVFREIPHGLYFYNIALSDADIFTYSWIGDFIDPLAFLELFRSDSSFNESGWKNESFDNLLEKASFVSDSERYNYLAEAEKLLLDDGMVIPISRTVSLNIVDPKEVGGWYPNAFNQHLFRYIYKKKVKVSIPNVVMR